jgi:hypothetical protein
MARNPAGTRFRIEVDGHPGILEYHGWTLRQGTIDPDVYRALCESGDAVEIERLHQELWRSLTP